MTKARSATAKGLSRFTVIINMLQFFLRIAVWVVMIGIGYLLFGPELFDSSRSPDPFASDKPLHLPPVKAPRHIELEKILEDRRLSEIERTEYQALVQKRQSNFWAVDGISVEKALAGIPKQRKQALVDLLEERGMSNDELAVFLTVVQRDHAALLRDRE